MADRRRWLNVLVALMMVFPVAGVACDGEADVDTDIREGESGENGGEGEGGEGGEGEDGGADVEVETE
jgi:hypothetical protein